MFNGKVNFAQTYFEGGVFLGTQFKLRADFSKTHFKRGNLTYARFYEGANFWGAQFDEYISFYGARFDGKANFFDAKIGGQDSAGIFKATKFRRPEDEERACRKAKKLLEEQGNKEEADNYFYREMEAIRKQKPWYYRYPEYVFIQKIFGYGVHPFWLWGWWLAIVLFFAAIYSIWGGIEEPVAKQWYDYLWFSIATAATPGYALYKPIGWFKFIAGIEAILGTFMWAAFIATFARKYMR